MSGLLMRNAQSVTGTLRITHYVSLITANCKLSSFYFALSGICDFSIKSFGVAAPQLGQTVIKILRVHTTSCKTDR